MVRLALTLLISLCTALATAGSYQLSLRIDDTPIAGPVTAELGTPLTVWLHYQGPADLDRIDIESWLPEVAITQGYTRREGEQQQLRLRITPRRIGLHSLPPLRLGGAQSRALALQVIAAQEHGEKLIPHWTLSHTTAWQGQSLSAQLTLDLASSSARLETELLRAPGFEVQSLPMQQTPLNNGLVRHRFAWLLRPQQAGDHQLTAPLLRYVRDGLPRRRFHFPDQQLNITALPGYVTPTIPVGRLRQTTRGGPILGEGISATALTEALARAGRRATASEHLDATLTLHSEARIDWARQEEGITGVVYFDPHDGRLRTLRPSPPNSWPTLTFSLILLVIGGLIGWQRQRLSMAWRVGRYRRQLRGMLRQAATAAATRTALLAHPIPGQMPQAHTTRQWLRQYQRHQTHNREALNACMKRLDAALYGAGEWSADEAHQLAALL